jgi:hypothetical protein
LEFAAARTVEFALEPRGLYSKRTQFWRRSSNSACARPGGEDTSAKRMRTSVGAIHDALPIFPLARLLLSAWLHQRSSHPCVHGTCQDALGIPEYHCQCDGGFSGDNCETNDDDCASFPCMHGGSCLDGADTFMCVCAVGHTGEMCEVSSALDPVWRDVRGAYAIDPGQHVLLNPVSRVNVGIGLSKPREQLHVRGDAGSDSLTTSKLFVTTSAHGQSLIPVTEEDIFSLNTLLPK